MPSCGLVVALSTKKMRAWRPPSAFGAKTTWTVQDPDGFTLAPVQWSDPGTIVKSLRVVPVMGLMPTALTVIVVVPGLVRVIVRAVLVVPTTWLKKLMTAGLTPAVIVTVAPGATPVPVSETDWTPLEAVLVTDRVPVRAPATLGANATWTVQLPLAATAVPLVHVLPVILKSPVALVAVTVAAPPPVTVNVAVWAVLVVPTVWVVGKASVAGTTAAVGCTSNRRIACWNWAVAQMLPSGPTVMPVPGTLMEKEGVATPAVEWVTDDPSGLIL